MSRLRKFRLEFYKTTGTRNSQGKWEVAIDPTAIPFKCSVQPADAQTIQLLPEGVRKNSIFEIWTSSNFGIEPGKEAGIGVQEGIGIVKLNNEDYKVFKIMPWQNKIRSHYVYAIARVNGK